MGNKISITVPSHDLGEEIMRATREWTGEIAEFAGVGGFIELEVIVNEKVKASATAQGVSRFTITAVGDGYEVHPKGNSGISINLWGGPNDNRGAGLWNNGDQNNPVKFVDATAVENMSKFAIIPYPA